MPSFWHLLFIYLFICLFVCCCCSRSPRKSRRHRSRSASPRKRDVSKSPVPRKRSASPSPTSREQNPSPRKQSKVKNPSPLGRRRSKSPLPARKRSVSPKKRSVSPKRSVIAISWICLVNRFTDFPLCFSLLFFVATMPDVCAEAAARQLPRQVRHHPRHPRLRDLPNRLVVEVLETQKPSEFSCFCTHS
jgi:hypothetical protein